MSTFSLLRVLLPRMAYALLNSMGTPHRLNCKKNSTALAILRARLYILKPPL